jgi:hypothetical protein
MTPKHKGNPARPMRRSEAEPGQKQAREGQDVQEKACLAASWTSAPAGATGDDRQIEGRRGGETVPGDDGEAASERHRTGGKLDRRRLATSLATRGASGGGFERLVAVRRPGGRLPLLYGAEHAILSPTAASHWLLDGC